MDETNSNKIHGRDGKDERNEIHKTESSLAVIKPMDTITPIMITPLALHFPHLLEHTTTDKKQLTAEEKRQKRLWRNRVAAKECRKKKKVYIHDLEDTIARLTKENKGLRQQVQELKEKVSILPIVDENYRLIKEVEKLNATLGPID